LECDEFVHKVRRVFGDHAEGIACLVRQTGVAEIESDVACFLA